MPYSQLTVLLCEMQTISIIRELKAKYYYIISTSHYKFGNDMPMSMMKGPNQYHCVDITLKSQPKGLISTVASHEHNGNWIMTSGFPYQWPVMRKVFLCHDIIMWCSSVIKSFWVWYHRIQYTKHDYIMNASRGSVWIILIWYKDI